MDGLYKGGQCNPNAVGATSNHYKRMMGALSNTGSDKIAMGQQGQSFEGDIAAG